MELNLFEFRSINLPDGTQIIDTTLKTVNHMRMGRERLCGFIQKFT